MPELTGIGCAHEVAHGGSLIPHSDRMQRWVNHPAFQRLHKLNQLGFLYLIYPGARHSRFAHSLEAFEVARKVCAHLLNDNAFRFLMSGTDIEVFLVASLLHDVGHYPLAHTIEDLRSPLGVGTPMDLSGIRADYEMLEFILKQRFGRFGTLWHQLEQDGIDPALIVLLASKGRPRSESEIVIQSLLDGPIDIDKIAYLRLDSTCSSVRYGSGIDLEALLDNIAVFLPSDYPNLRTPQIGIRSDGISAAESIITARYYMFSRVYWHRTNRAIMAMISDAMHRLVTGDDPVFSFEAFIKANLNASDWEALSWVSSQLDGAIDKELLRTPSQRPVGNSIKGIIDGTRHLHKRLITFWRSPDTTQYAECHDFLVGLSRPELETVRGHCLELIASRTGVDWIQDQEVLVDAPRGRKERDAIASIWVLDQQSGYTVEMAIPREEIILIDAEMY